MTDAGSDRVAGSKCLGPTPSVENYRAGVGEAPIIEALKWVDIRTVLPNEALQFTPWLADNLNLLADALGLDELRLVGTEQSVDEFRLDIAAVGTDGSGDEIAVVIENQYGRSDHDHLGKLITYTARAESDAEQVLGVWLVEQPTAAHQAAVEFLNRVSVDYVGWTLVSPRFVEGPHGYYVHFEKHAEPNAFLRSATSSGGSRAVPPERTAFMASVFDLVDTPLRSAGFRHVWCHPDGHMIRAYLPSSIPASVWAEIRVLAQQNRFRVVLFVRGADASAEQNQAVLEGIRSRHAAAIADAVEDPDQIVWHARSPNDRSDYARYTWEGHGYLNTDPPAAARRVTTFATACLAALRDDTDEEFPEPDELTASADSATVMALAGHLRPGEWTTYGDLSSVLTGGSSAAMAIGNIARTNPDFPNPHRILNRRGRVPTGWTTSDGRGGPEVCQQCLESEGVGFVEGVANPDHCVSVDVLRQRFEQDALS